MIYNIFSCNTLTLSHCDVNLIYSYNTIYSYIIEIVYIPNPRNTHSAYYTRPVVRFYIIFVFGGFLYGNRPAAEAVM